MLFSLRLAIVVTVLACALAQNRTANARVSTIAGTPVPGDVDATGTQARFRNPSDVVLVPNDEKTCIVADSANNKIKMIRSSDWRNPASSVVTTLAGNGIQGWVDGDSTQARFKKPLGVAVHPEGTWVAVADTSNNRIRSIDIATGAVGTVTGSGRSGYLDGVATLAQFRNPTSLAFSADGTALAIADEGNYRIRWHNITTGYTSTLSGSRIKSPKCSYGDFLPRGSCPRGRCQCPELTSRPLSQPPASDEVCPEWVPNRPAVDFDMQRASERMCCRAVDYNLLAGDPTFVCSHGLARPACTNPDGATTGCVCNPPNTGVACSNSNQCNNSGICVGTAEYYDGEATRSAFRAPTGVVFSQDFQHLFLADALNHLVRRIDVATGDSASVAGVPQRLGNLDGQILVTAGNGVGAAVLNFPASVAVPKEGSWMLVVDRLNARVRRVNMATQQLESVTGWTACTTGRYTTKGGCWTLADCLCNETVRVAEDASFCADGSNPDDVPNDGVTPPCTCTPPNEGGTCTIDFHCTGGGKCETWSIGYEDGAASLAKFRDPMGSAIVSSGTGLLVADSGNHAIRYVDCGGSCGDSTILVDMSVQLGQEDEGEGQVLRSQQGLLALSLLAHACWALLWARR